MWTNFHEYFCRFVVLHQFRISKIFVKLKWHIHCLVIKATNFHNFYAIFFFFAKNPNYFFLQILDLIVFICVMCSGSYFRNISTGQWTDFVAMTGFWVSGILLFFYLLHVMEKFHVIPWLMIEMGFCCLWSFFFLTCSLGNFEFN